VFDGINDVPKPAMATATITDSSHTDHVPVYDPRAASPVAQSGFTAAAIRMMGRALGLFGATQGILYQTILPATLDNPRPGQPADPQQQWRAYFQTVDWTWATTATPMSTGWWYGRYEILDQDAIARAQAIDWLDRSLSDVQDAFAALEGRGYRSVPAAVTSRILSAGKYIGATVVDMIQGLDKLAVQNGMAAKRAMGSIVPLALSQRRVAR
jgi:hypothetical protein